MDQEPEHLNVMFSPKYAVPVFGYAVPPLAISVLLLNSLMVWTLSKRELQSPVNTVLTCIAVSDVLAISLPAIPFVHFYTMGNYQDFVPFAWCRVFFSLVHILPLMCNMASLWSTVALATIRCYSVWRPLHVKSTITISRTRLAIVIIYLFSALVYTPIMFEYTYTPLSTPSMMRPNTTITSCHLQKSNSHLMLNFCTVHAWVQIVCTSLLPWFLIAFPDAGMLWKLRKADRTRSALHGTRDTGHEKDAMFLNKKTASRHRMTTWLIVLVVSMVWLVEIPFAVSLTIYLSHTNGDVMRNPLGDNVVFVFLLKYITYPLIFFVYCFMSERFRKAFWESISCLCSASDKSMRELASSPRTTRSRVGGRSGYEVPLRPQSTSS